MIFFYTTPSMVTFTPQANAADRAATRSSAPHNRHFNKSAKLGLGPTLGSIHYGKDKATG